MTSPTPWLRRGGWRASRAPDGGARAQGDDERAHRNFHLRHFSVLGGLAPRLSSAAVICNKSVSYKIGLTQDAPPQVIVWTKCDG